MPAFWVGLLYNSESLDGVFDLTRDWYPDEWARFRLDAARIGFKAEICGQKLQTIAADLLELAHSGLIARSRMHLADLNEAHFLNDLHSVVENQETMAEEMLRFYHDEWGRLLAPAYDVYAF